MVTYRDVVVAPVPLAALGTPPVLVPDVVAELHAGGDLLLALGHRAAALAHVVLLLRPLGPVGRGGPGDGRQAPVLLILACLDGLGALLRVPVLVVTHVTLQTAHYIILALRIDNPELIILTVSQKTMKNNSQGR